MLSPIFDSFYADRARSGATDLCVNLYPEGTATPKGMQIELLTGTPGLSAPRITVGGGPIRKMLVGSDGLLYVVSGSNLYAVSSNYAATTIGSLASSSGPVQMIENPTQVLVVDGANGYLATKGSTGLSVVIPNTSTDDTGPESCAYQDGFGIVTSAGSNEIYQSNYNDFSQFASLPGPTANNAFVQGDASNVVSVFDFKREMWILKTNSIEVWINQGTSGFAFTQLQGVLIPTGCAAPNSVAHVGESLCWLGRDIYMSVGYNYRTISTPAISAMIESSPVVSDAIAYGHKWDAHDFYTITFPSQGITLTYDIATGKWHQRAFFTPAGGFGRELANCHAYFSGDGLVGDYRNGNIYAMSDSLFTDNGQPRKWLRSWRALTSDQPQGIPMSFDQLQLLMETGITTPEGTNPQIMLRWSNDGGYTWPGSVQLSAGRVGQTSWRVLQRRLGSTTLNRGLDRVWEASSVDPIRIAITGADWEGGPT